MIEVYGTLTIDFSTLVDTDDEDIAKQQVNRLLDRIGLRRDTIQIDIFGEKVELQIHNSDVSVEEVYCEDEVV